jgi:hypothetical protein
LNNPWKDFDYTNKRQVHPVDLAGFDAFNERIGKRKNSQRLKLSDTHTPLPYFGNKDAGFVILMANPGLDPVKTALEEKPAMRKLFDQARKHEKMSSPFVFLDDEFIGTPGHQWWSKRLRRIIDEVSLENVRKGIFSAEIHPYKSVNYAAVHEELPTQRYTAELVKQLIDRGSLVLMGRARAEWIHLVPALEKYKNVIELNSKQNSFITEKNTKRGDFRRILQALS